MAVSLDNRDSTLVSAIRVEPREQLVPYNSISGVVGDFLRESKKLYGGVNYIQKGASPMTTKTLNNKVKIPTIGFGTWKTAGEDCSTTIKTAIQAGYRYFDTASFYGTESGIGQALQESNIDRKEFFLASKVWKEEMGYDNTIQAFENTLKRLQTNYLDLYLIHWPIPIVGMPADTWKQLDLDTWKAMEDLYRSGKIRAIGVSNFLPHHLDNLLEHCDVVPAANQLELHPGYLQSAAVQYCEQHNILLQAWSPLGRGRVAQEPLLIELAEKYQVKNAQICLRFLLQKGYILLPKSSNISRMQENQDIFKFEISREDIFRIETLPQTGWSGEHPDYERIKI